MERTGFEQWRPREVARLLALVETERRYYQEMVAALPVPLVILAQDRTIISANRAFRSTVNLRIEELRNKSIEQILPSDELVERIRLAHVHGDAGPFVLRLPERTFRATAIPILSWEEETASETLLVIEDLSIAEAPPVPAAPVPAPLDLSGCPAIFWQAGAHDLRFRQATGAVEEILGYPAAHWIEAPEFFTGRIHPEDRERVMALYRPTIERGGTASAEYRALAASGQPVWCRETIRIPEPSGESARAIAGVLLEMGERRQLEIQALNASRTEALRALASRLAHDLNNPLMIVTGYAEEMVNSLPPGNPLLGDVAEILAASGRMSEVTAQLLSFAHPHVNPAERLPLSRTVAGLEERLRTAAGESIALETASPEGEVWAMADREQLEETILALAAAALDHTHEISRLSVTCQTDRVSEQVAYATLPPGNYARVYIRAAGSGLGTPATGLFETFLFAKDPRRASGPAIARAYAQVREWGGDIFFTSGANGSAFSLYLPYAEPEAAAPAEEPAAPVAEAPAPVEQPAPAPVIAEPAPEPPRAIILLVEDEAGIRALVRKILTRERYLVLEAGSAEDALRIAAEREGAIDLLLTDVILPGIGGAGLAGSLREARPEIKVVYISGYTPDESVRAGEFPPGSKFLQKPFTLGALTNKVREALEG